MEVVVLVLKKYYGEIYFLKFVVVLRYKLSDFFISEVFWIENTCITYIKNHSSRLNTTSFIVESFNFI